MNNFDLFSLSQYIFKSFSGIIFKYFLMGAIVFVAFLDGFDNQISLYQ